MNVKGFIIEDDEGREFVVVCERPYRQLGGAFLLRGWQRRRLVPLHYSERALRQIVGKVLISLDDLFRSLPRFSSNAEMHFPLGEGATTSRLRKPMVLRKVDRDENCIGKVK